MFVRRKPNPSGVISIQIIDKSSGLLTFEKMEVTWTYEDDSIPEPEKKSAWVILPRIRQGITITKPTLVIGEWSVRVQDMPGGKINVFTNLIYVKYTTVYHDRYNKYSKENIPQSFSSGILEKLLFARIN